MPPGRRFIYNIEIYTVYSIQCIHNIWNENPCISYIMFNVSMHLKHCVPTTYIIIFIRPRDLYVCEHPVQRVLVPYDLLFIFDMYSAHQVYKYVIQFSQR